MRKTTFLFLIWGVGTGASFNPRACCRTALEEGAILNASPKDAVCEDDSAPGNPYPGLLVSYDFCRAKCSGIGGIQPDETSAFFQFILPAVIFSMTIPRAMKLDHARFSKHFRLTFLSMGMIVSILIAFIDVVVWTTIIMVAAAPMFLGALLESLLDRRALVFLQKHPQHRNNVPTRAQVEILSSILAGNLDRTSGDPQSQILKCLLPPVSHDTQRRSRLTDILNSQYDFGATVGAPVAFYITAFLYTIIDLFNSPDSLYAGTSIALGIEWMIAVHVAIVSGCLLASNSPCTISVLVGDPPERRLPNRTPTLEVAPAISSSQSRGRTRSFLRKWIAWDRVYDTLFHPVQLWDRGDNKLEWMTHTDIYNCSASFRDAVRVSTLDWLFEVFLPALVLIVGPPVVGSIVNYTTPPIGFGCDSLTLLCYASSQAVLAFNTAWTHFTGRNQTSFGQCVRTTLTYIAYGVSVLTVIVGTLLKGFGVYSNCFCSRLAKDWMNPAAPVLVTWNMRDLQRSLKFWYFSGSAFGILLVILCIAGWFYQEHVQNLLKEAIQRLPDDNNATLDMDDMRELDVVNRQSNPEQSEPEMPEIVSGPSFTNLQPVRGQSSTRGLRTTSSTEPLLTETERPESEIATATSSTERISTGQLRSRALRSTKTFPGGRDDSTY